MFGRAIFACGGLRLVEAGELQSLQRCSHCQKFAPEWDEIAEKERASEVPPLPLTPKLATEDGSQSDFVGRSTAKLSSQAWLLYVFVSVRMKDEYHMADMRAAPAALQLVASRV